MSLLVSIFTAIYNFFYCNFLDTLEFTEGALLGTLIMSGY